jgi:PEP-CTERM motif
MLVLLNGKKKPTCGLNPYLTMHTSKYLLSAIAALTVGLASASAAVVFTQDFSSSNTLGDYIGNGANQINTVGDNALTGARNFTVSGGQLIITRSASGDNNYPVLRFGNGNQGEANFSGSIATGYKFTATVSVAGYTNDNGTSFVLESGYTMWGNMQSGAVRVDGRAGSASNVYFNASGTSGGGNTWNAGASTNVTWVVNNTGSTYVYTGPDGNSRSLATGLYDFWIGTNASGSRLGVGYSVNSNGINSFQLTLPNWSSAVNTIAVDNIVVSDLVAAPIPEPSSYAALVGAAALGCVALRRRRRAAL